MISEYKVDEKWLKQMRELQPHKQVFIVREGKYFIATEEECARALTIAVSPSACILITSLNVENEQQVEKPSLWSKILTSLAKMRCTITLTLALLMTGCAANEHYANPPAVRSAATCADLARAENHLRDVQIQRSTIGVNNLVAFIGDSGASNMLAGQKAEREAMAAVEKLRAKLSTCILKF